MAQPIDALQSFTYLTENIPHWIDKLNALNTQCDEQYERFYKLTKNGQVKLTRKKKHDSTETLRAKKDVNKTTSAAPSVGARAAKGIDGITTVETQQTTVHDSVQMAPASVTTTSPDANRKRKPGSDLSGPSGPGLYRTRSMIVVYYDSAIQEGFATLVKDIATARSTLRKGRTSITFQARLASMGLPSADGQSDSSTISDPKDLVAALGRNRLGTRTGGSSTEKAKFKLFDEADQGLAESQSLSEKGAHQFLRDGYSRVEIEGMRKRFRAVQALAEKEVQRLKGVSEKTQSPGTQQSAKSSPRDKVEKSEDTNLGPTAGKTDPLPAGSASPPETPTGTKVLHPISLVQADSEIPSPTTKQLNFTATGMIEVDEAASDASSVKVDIAALRRITRRA